MSESELAKDQISAHQSNIWKRLENTIWEFSRETPIGAAAAVVLLFMFLIAVFGPWITPQDPLTNNIASRLLPPSLSNLMGTDEYGRDVLSRIIAGTRVAIVVSVVAAFAGSTIGALVGITSGYLGGKVDMIMQRFMDMIMAFPPLILAIAISAVMGASIFTVIVAITVPMMPRANRVIRSVAISAKESVFIEAARAVGAKPARIIFIHLLPNCVAAYLILLTSALGICILIEASLSFLGLGIPPPHPSWGRDISMAMSYLDEYPWLAIFPGIAISLFVFGANLFGDALRDKFDPRLKRL